MATFPENPIQGSPMIGSPITVTIVPATHQQAWTFHRLMLKVVAGLVVPDVDDPNYPGDEDYTELEFSTPVDANTAQVQFDVSSALRAVADRYEASAVPPSQNAYVKFRIEAWDEWLVDGANHQNDASLLPGKLSVRPWDLFYFYAFIGELTDAERLKAVNGSRTMTKWTRKPNDVAEVVFVGSRYVRPINFSTGLESDHASSDLVPQFVSGAPVGGPKSEIYPTSTPFYINTEGLHSFGGVHVYAVKKYSDGYEMRFRNGLGCIESVCLRCLAQKQVKIQTEQFTIARQETLNKFSRSLAVKSGNVEQWKMTSGPQSELWAAWYVHEFLKVQDAWINIDYTWVRCHILPEETITMTDRVKTDMMEVQFTIQLDIEGSPLSALAI